MLLREYLVILEDKPIFSDNTAQQTNKCKIFCFFDFTPVPEIFRALIHNILLENLSENIPIYLHPETNNQILHVSVHYRNS